MDTLRHPYREQPAVVPLPKVSWWHRLWYGDDGYRYAVILQPSPFRNAESELHGPYTKRRAFKVMRAFVAANPYGEATAYKSLPGSSWPPPMNFTPANIRKGYSSLRLAYIPEPPLPERGLE